MGNKISKATALYRSTAKRPKLCTACKMFRLLNSCTLVQGTISPFGTCKFWEKKR